MGIGKLFRRKHSFFPLDRKGRLETIMAAHREITDDDAVAKESTLELLFDQIGGETDTFLLDSYVIYYIGYYKPFESGNRETAKKVADGILADGGWYMPQEPVTCQHLEDVFNNQYCIESIMEWQKKHVRKLRIYAFLIRLKKSEFGLK